MYCLLLIAYPADFRRAYGRHMAQVFRDSCREALESYGVSGLVKLWISILYDVCTTALSERKATMREYRLVRLALLGTFMLLAILSIGLIIGMFRMGKVNETHIQARALNPSHAVLTCYLESLPHYLIANYPQSEERWVVVIEQGTPTPKIVVISSDSGQSNWIIVRGKKCSQ
jgi:hypothetical protein